MRLHAKLQRLAERRNLSAPEIAAALAGPSASTVRRWLNGQGEPSLSEARRLAELFAVAVGYLADDRADEPEPGLSEAEQVALDTVRALALDRLEVIRRLHGRAAHPLADPASTYGVDPAGSGPPRRSREA